MIKNVAVITDAMTPDHYFPLWLRYYGGMFGAENLYVGTYGDSTNLFDGVCGPNFYYIGGTHSEAARTGKASNLTAQLLQKYDVVIRVDPDEFLVAPGHHDLASFIEVMDYPYLTVHGINVIELRNDLPLDIKQPIMAQRNSGVSHPAWSKTCITRVPLKWSEGFHTISAQPIYGGLFNLHLKYADLNARLSWCRRMLNVFPCFSNDHKYFMLEIARIGFREQMFHGYKKEKFDPGNFLFENTDSHLNKETGFYDRSFDDLKIMLSLEAFKGCL